MKIRQDFFTNISGGEACDGGERARLRRKTRGLRQGTSARARGSAAEASQPAAGQEVGVLHPLLASQLTRLLGAPAGETPAPVFEQLRQFLAQHGAASDLLALAQRLPAFLHEVDAAYSRAGRSAIPSARSPGEFLDNDEVLRRTLAARDAAIAQLRSLVRRLQQRSPAQDVGDISAASVSSLLGLIGDMIERQEVQQAELVALHDDLARQQVALDQHAIVSTTDLDGNITYVNDRFCEISGYTRGELLGANHRIVKSDEHPPVFFEELWATIVAGRVWHGEVKNRKKNGDHYWVSSTIVPFRDASGKVAQYVSIRTDISERKLAEEALIVAKEEAERANRALQVANAQLQRLATTDRLTGAWNRRHFEQQVELAVALARRHGTPLSLLLFDIDHFKSVNDRFGHLAGDRVLVEVCAKVRASLRKSDILARWGGEEFVVMLPHCALSGAVHLAEKLRRLLESAPVEGVGVVTASFGVSQFAPQETVGECLRRVDSALYAAKSAGRNTVHEG